MTPHSNRKPHNGNAGYVCERKCRVGGHIVIYDRDRTDIDADHRWIVMHEPSSVHVAIKSQRAARDLMKSLADGDPDAWDWTGTDTTLDTMPTEVEVAPSSNGSASIIEVRETTSAFATERPDIHTAERAEYEARTMFAPGGNRPVLSNDLIGGYSCLRRVGRATRQILVTAHLVEFEVYPDDSFTVLVTMTTLGAGAEVGSNRELVDLRLVHNSGKSARS